MLIQIAAVLLMNLLHIMCLWKQEMIQALEPDHTKREISAQLQAPGFIHTDFGHGDNLGSEPVNEIALSLCFYLLMYNFTFKVNQITPYNEG